MKTKKILIIIGIIVVITVALVIAYNVGHSYGNVEAKARCMEQFANGITTC